MEDIRYRIKKMKYKLVYFNNKNEKKTLPRIFYNFTEIKNVALKYEEKPSYRKLYIENLITGNLYNCDGEKVKIGFIKGIKEKFSRWELLDI